ncbi:MAG: ribosome small subunit-dependent GTPase A [Anaerolineales bacterium]|nr:ribosome small subunit-dependent GTPase A [Anaerolineales bacterium]
MIRSQSGFFSVQTKKGVLVCKLRGRLKQGIREGDLAAIGDQVTVTKIRDSEGVIESVEERQRMISRMAPLPRGEYEQIIIANPDQIVLVFACAQPEPRLRMLDRFLIISEHQTIPAVIVANKTDLVTDDEAHLLFNHYKDIGYSLIYSSVPEKRGIEQLREKLAGKISALAGPSGAGKSSLLNAIQPGLGLSIQNVSQTTGKGKHTTVSSELYPLKDGGYVADTPGMKALALWDIEPEELDGYFPDISQFVAQCQFSNCTHVHEPGCAVLEAVETGNIHPQRYDSYLRLRFEEQ